MALLALLWVIALSFSGLFSLLQQQAHIEARLFHARLQTYGAQIALEAFYHLHDQDLSMPASWPNRHFRGYRFVLKVIQHSSSRLLKVDIVVTWKKHGRTPTYQYRLQGVLGSGLRYDGRIKRENIFVNNVE